MPWLQLVRGVYFGLAGVRSELHIQIQQNGRKQASSAVSLRHKRFSAEWEFWQSWILCDPHYHASACLSDTFLLPTNGPVDPLGKLLASWWTHQTLRLSCLSRVPAIAAFGL
jgi:hypothetical protein